MHRRVPLALLAVLALLVVPATVAAAQPELQATVVPGREIDIVGSGFPASTDVILVIHRSNNPDETRTLRADATGAFTTTIDAGPGQGGAYTLVATAGSSTASANVVAVETAGGAGGGVQAPPATSTQPQPGADTGQSCAPIPVVMIVALAVVAGAWWSVRRVRQTAR